MKKLIYAIAAIAFVASTGCNNENRNDGLAQHHHSHSHEGHAHAEGDEIELEPDVAERLGVKVDTLRPAPFGQVIHVSGEIFPAAGSSAVVTAPTAGIVTLAGGINAGASVGAGATVATIRASNVSGGDANAAARAELEAARKEVERLTPLYEKRIVSARDYNAAVAAYERAKAGYSSSAASGRASSPIAGVVTSVDVAQGQFVETGAPIATVSASKHLTLRADVPQKFYGSLPSVTDARVALPYSSGSILISELGGRRTSAASTATTPGYVPVFFTFDNDGSVLPGTQVEIYLLAEASREALAVPLAAVTEQQGNHFVFVRLDKECYAKVPVTLGASNGDAVEITSGLHGGEAVVVEGATAVRLAQSSTVVPEGHSHSH